MKESIPDDGVVDAITQAIIAVVTPELVAPVILTLAATHLAKILAEHWLTSVTESARRWRAFCVTVSIGIGTLAGAGAWLGAGAPWYIVPAVAFGAGPAWRGAQTVLPERLATAFLTATDRRFRRRPKS